MEVFYVYILYSEKLKKHYIGFSSDIEKRLDYHNSTKYNHIWTKRGIPWNLVFKHAFDNKPEALKAEKFIKKQKSKQFILKLIQKGWK